MDELQAGVELAFAVLPQPAILFQSGKTALDHPALGDNNKLVQLAAFGNLHRDSFTQYGLHTQRKGFAHITPVSEHTLHPAQAGLAAVHGLQCPFAIRHIGGCHCDGVRQSLCIDANVALDARDLLACVIALESSCLRVLDALRIHDQQRRLCVASQFLAGRANLIFLKPAPAR